MCTNSEGRISTPYGPSVLGGAPPVAEIRTEALPGRRRKIDSGAGPALSPALAAEEPVMVNKVVPKEVQFK